jgi:hypothetical protein
MKNKNILDKLITPTNVLCFTGLIIISAGIYYSITGETSSGVTMGKYGRKYGTGVIDGNGMIFCSLIFFALGFFLRDKKEDKK